MNKQIIGQNLDLAFKELPVEAVKMYESKENEFGSKYQVWELTESEYEKLEQVNDDSWKVEYGWWRNGGTNMDGSETLEFNINGNTMIGFKNEYSWYHSEDYLSELDEDEEPSLPSYSNFSDWFEEYMGLSKSENLTYFAHSLAKYNKMSKAEFLIKFEGQSVQ